MNMRHLPTTTGKNLAHSPETGRSVDFGYPGGFPPEFSQEKGDFRSLLLKYIGLAFKHKWLIGAIVTASLFLGVVATLMMNKIYVASTTVKIDRVVPKVMKAQDSSGDAGNDPQFFKTQYELIKSRALAERAVASLNLVQSNFLSPPPSLTDRIFGSRGAAEQLDSSGMEARRRATINAVMSGLRVLPVPMSSLVEIKFASTSPLWAQQISIGVAEAYERFTLDRRFGVSKYARDFLDERLQELKIKLQDSEKQLIEYAQRVGVVSSNDKQPFSNTGVTALDAALAAATAERVRVEQIWRQAEADDGNSLPQVIADPLILAARTRLAALQASYQEKLAIMKPAFPEMVSLKSQIQENEKQIRTQVNLIKSSLQSQYETALRQEKALEAQLEASKKELLELRGKNVEYGILMREVDTARSLYDGLLQQFREVSVAAEVDTNNVSIIDRAELPTFPERPSLRYNLIIALMLGVMIAAATVGVIEILDDTFKSPEDLEERLGLPVLGVLPKFTPSMEYETPIKEIVADPTSALAEAYRSTRTALQFSTDEGAPKILLVTSSRPGEGKSTSAVSLAINFGQLGQKVLLIDADLRNPSLHKITGVANASGLSNYLAGSVEAEKLVQATPFKSVYALPTGPLPPNPVELLSSARMQVLLNLTRETFDMVIIDGPPVMGLADAPVISSQVDGVFFVIEAGRTRRGIVADALRRLEFARARLVGCVLNKFDAKSAGYGYGYGYGYSYGYSYGAELYGYGRKTQALPDGSRNA